MKDIIPGGSEDSKTSLRSLRRSSARMQTGWLWYVLLVVFFGLGLGIGYLVWGVSPTGQTAQLTDAQAAAPTTDPNAPRTVTRYPVTVDDDPAYGPADAPVTIIEFSDYQCPYCQKWHVEVWPLLKKAYGDKIRLVYRDFPLYSIHPEAGPAAEAANCAGDQNKYWEFHNLLFSGQNELGATIYRTYADNLNLDMDLFVDCVESQKYKDEVSDDFNYGGQIGIQSTPTFFINGVALIGAQPFDVFQEIIDLELAGLLSE